MANQFREKIPELGTRTSETENDFQASTSFPSSHSAQIHSTNPLETLNAATKSHNAGMGMGMGMGMGILPIDSDIARQVYAMLQKNDAGTT